jgi:hypothetical protein
VSSRFSSDANVLIVAHGEIPAESNNAGTGATHNNGQRGCSPGLEHQPAAESSPREPSDPLIVRHRHYGLGALDGSGKITTGGELVGFEVKCALDCSIFDAIPWFCGSKFKAFCQ